MQVDIFDVGHGQCAVVTSPNGRRIMIDCGVKVRNGRFWSPSLHYYGEYFDVLALSNLDEDHIRNFYFMLTSARVGQVLSNPTIGINEFRLLKKDGMGSGSRTLASWMHDPLKPAPAPCPDFDPVKLRWYYNPFILGLTRESNDLSLVIFIEYSGFKMIFSGDMEATGWEHLLRNPTFCSDLYGTSIFVASHHGRENGKCARLFNWFMPEIIVISDDEKQYGSQDTSDWYAERCTGAVSLAKPSERRYVVTTRKDGSMHINVGQTGSWVLQPVEVRDWPIEPSPALPWNQKQSYIFGPLSDRAANPFLSAARRL